MCKNIAKTSARAFFFALIFLISTAAYAEERILHLVYKIPEVTDEMVKKNPGTTKDTLIVQRSRAVSTELAKRIEKRLKAAKIKDFQVVPENFEVKVVIGGKDSQEPRIIELLKGPGIVELRPVLESGGPNWAAMAPALPTDVNVTGTESYQYLWTTNRDALQETLNAASMLSPETISRDGKPAEKRLVAAPDRAAQKPHQSGNAGLGGWRSYLLGKIVASNDVIEKTSWKMDAVGGFSMTVALRKPVSVPPKLSSEIAILVDNEVIAILPSNKVGSQFTIVAPHDLSKPQQRVWARAMAGKFSAEILIPFAIADYKEERKK